MLKKNSEWNSVTIVFINYNNKKDLKESIKTLLCKTVEDIEILVVDNGSQDGSMEYIEKYYPYVHTEYLGENMGFGRGCNRGMEIAFERGSKFVMLLNTDTEIEEGMISELKRYCDDNTVVIPRIYRDKEDRENSLWYSGGRINFVTGEVEQTLFKYDAEDAECNRPRQVEFATGCCIMVSRAVWERVGGFAEEYFLYYEDVDYCMRLKECGVNILYVPKAALWHKIGGSAGGEISAISLYYTVRNRLVFADKYQQYFKSDIKGILRIILEYFTSPYNQKYEVIVLSAVKDYLKGLLGKEKNHIYDGYTIIRGFFDAEGEGNDLWRWCGSSEAEMEIYNSNGEQAIQELLLTFTILPAPLRTDVHLTVKDDSTGITNTISAGVHHLKFRLKPYERIMLRFCTDEVPVTGYEGDIRNLFYQIRNIQLEML